MYFLFNKEYWVLIFVIVPWLRRLFVFVDSWFGCVRTGRMSTTRQQPILYCICFEVQCKVLKNIFVSKGYKVKKYHWLLKRQCDEQRVEEFCEHLGKKKESIPLRSYISKLKTWHHYSLQLLRLLRNTITFDALLLSFDNRAIKTLKELYYWKSSTIKNNAIAFLFFIIIYF